MQTYISSIGIRYMSWRDGAHDVVTAADCKGHLIIGYMSIKHV